MKKSILVAAVIAFMTLMASWYSFADVTGVADTSKEGSLLIWPLVQTNGGNETYIVITNSEAGGNESQEQFDLLVNVKCYWEARTVPYDGSGGFCPIKDAVFKLSINNPLIFKASDGTNLTGEEGVVPGIGYEQKGALKCWAVSADDAHQMSWNHLSGYAIIVKPEPEGPGGKDSAWKYSAWRFAANVVEDATGTTFVDGPWLGPSVGVEKPSNPGKYYTSNVIQLWGANKVVGASDACPAGTTKIQRDAAAYLCVQQADPADCTAENLFLEEDCAKPEGAYDACPQYLLFNFLAEPSPPDFEDGHALNYLALAPCKEDLRGDDEEDDNADGAADFYTRLVFTVWNSNEIKFTGTTSCAHCNGDVGNTYDVYLSELKVGGESFFQQSFLHTNSGRLKVQGKAAGPRGECASAKATPLVGVMGRTLTDPASIDLVGTGGTAAGAQFNKNGNGLGPGYIRWDGGEPEVPEAPKR